MGERMSSVVIADDLTGACDSAVQFTMRGARSVVHLNSELPHDSAADVEAFSTNTRDVNVREMEARIRGVASLFSRSELQLVFKKIDSVMRGNPGKEIITAMDAFGCDLAVITPAFPEMGRTVQTGLLTVHGDSTWRPLDVVAVLRNQGLDSCTHVQPALVRAAIKDGVRYISADIACNDDLRVLVKEVRQIAPRVLWAGSGGLASALAEALFPRASNEKVRAAGNLPVLFCIGSDHPMTAAQIKTLQLRRGASRFSVDSVSVKELAIALSSGDHVIVQISWEREQREHIQSLLRGVRPLFGAMLLSGGDTASMICESLGVLEIELENQIVTGVPAGVLRGGHFDGLPVATKSGGFGREDALIQVADYFTCLNS